MQKSDMELLWESAHLYGGNSTYIDELYETYLRNPNDIPQQWRNCFDQLPSQHERDVSHAEIQQQFLQLCRKPQSFAITRPLETVTTDHEKKQIRVLRMINAYRFRGHQQAKLDPLEIWEREPVKDLAMSYYGFTDADNDIEFTTGTLFLGQSKATLKEISQALVQTYCDSLGAEYMHIVDSAEKRWIQQRLESVRSKPKYNEATKKHLLERLVAAEGLEKYLGSRYPGTKRFGLEGGESLVPMVDELIQRSGAHGCKEVVIGMAHRGRLNLLVNTLGKNPADLFDEFDGKQLVDTSGDVKYHQGFSSNVMTPGGEVHLAMAFNPSHLEIVSPVVEGSVRARQDRRGDDNHQLVLPVAIHGDAAFAGQGVVMETFQMSQTRGYKTGGTVHIIVNNQVGFTTSKREDARSTEYCTDIAKMVQAPIFHVNGDDPEAVLFATQVALDYRNEFKKDVVIDLYCYRRRGHNEADEPSGTQPLMYKKIKSLPTTLTIYAKQLIEEGVLNQTEYEGVVNGYREDLEEGRHVTKSLVHESREELFVDWSPYLNQEWTNESPTAIELKKLQSIGQKIHAVPEGFPIQRQVKKIVEDREKMTAGALPINWGYGELLAYATLLEEGYGVRITGQDVGRGTFSHRHVVLHNQNDASTYNPLCHIKQDQPPFEIYDSFLSELAVLGFEYGYATTAPKSLVIWEAQFGDFANGAQIVIDQFITSGEHKWGRLCGLVMLLPHGYEGQGPEHSSARLERYLQLCAEHNVQVCVPSTPAQVYHMLRRQMVRNVRKPLIALSPKSLLRHKLAVSTLEDLSEGKFHTVLPEQDELDNAKVKRVVLCSGKVYYDLLEKRRELESDVAILRLEQLYPFPKTELLEDLKIYPNLEELVWCQEEPLNQGAWYSSQHHMHLVVKQLDNVQLKHVTREASAAPAVGYLSVHIEQQAQLVEQALTAKLD